MKIEKGKPNQNGSGGKATPVESPPQTAGRRWKTIPIFISSTFRDMHAERDHLAKVVFPALEERLRERRCRLEPIDLRLGVETDDTATERERNPQSADYARDLWISYFKLANLTEKNGNETEAVEWWRKSHDTLAGMKQRGMEISAEDESILEKLRERVKAWSIPVSRSEPYSAYDANRAAELIAQYQNELKHWKALPWWKRVKAKKPDSPKRV